MPENNVCSLFFYNNNKNNNNYKMNTTVFFIIPHLAKHNLLCKALSPSTTLLFIIVFDSIATMLYAQQIIQTKIKLKK